VLLQKVSSSISIEISLYRKNQANVALKYLKSALELETSSQQDAMNIAGTMLNICAILSMLKKYS
jgi:hypothetical protein